jgi:hypothetical protein
MRRAIALIPLYLAAIVITLSAGARPADAGWEKVGMRAGISATGSVNIYEYEIFTAYRLPWGLGSEDGWHLTTKGNGSVGVLHGDGAYGYIASLGPGIGVGKGGIPLELSGGVNLAFLSQDTFDGRDLNGNLQFISHVDLSYRPQKGLGVGYNFQHMSNASLNGSKNPGLNMHMISVTWYFGR